MSQRLYIPCPSLFVAILLLGLAVWPTKGQSQVYPPGENDPVCSGLSHGLSALAGHGIGALTRSQAVSVFLAGFAAGTAGPYLSERCTNWLNEFAEHFSENPVDYDEFVRNYCDGDPFACRGNLGLPQNPWEDPYECILIIDCSSGGLPDEDSPLFSQGMSANDFVKLVDHAYYSYYAGYWLPAPSFIDETGGGCGIGDCQGY